MVSPSPLGTCRWNSALTCLCHVMFPMTMRDASILWSKVKTSHSMFLSDYAAPSMLGGTRCHWVFFLQPYPPDARVILCRSHQLWSPKFPCSYISWKTQLYGFSGWWWQITMLLHFVRCKPGSLCTHLPFAGAFLSRNPEKHYCLDILAMTPGKSEQKRQGRSQSIASSQF